MKKTVLTTLLSGMLTASALAGVEIKVFHSLADVRDPAEAVPGGTLALTMARNEYESVQLAVAASEPVVLAFSLPAVPGLTFSLFRIAEAGGVPDVLVPLPEGGSVEVAAGQPAYFWLTVKTAVQAEPGGYPVSLTVTAPETALHVPLQIEVTGFTMPAAPPIAVAAGIMDRQVADIYHRELDSEAGCNILLQWHEKCLEYGLSPYFWRPVYEEGQTPLNYCYPSPWPADDPRTAALLADPRQVAFAVPFCNPDDPDAEELRRFADLLAARNWHDRSFCYVFDEPTDEYYPAVHERAARLRAIDPAIPVLVSYFCGPDRERESLGEVYDAFGEDCDIHSMSYWAIGEDEGFIDRLRRQPRRPEVWPYVCCGPGEPAPNYFLGMSGLQHRFVLWRAWKENASGFLYWAVNAFSGRAAVPGGLPAFNPAFAAGDGVLLYPAEDFIAAPPASGFQPPLASVRLARLRDSLEDWALFEACAEQDGRETVLAAVREVYPAPYQYPDDPAAVDTLRRKLFATLH